MEDRVGTKYGKLTCVAVVSGNPRASFLCECGNTKDIDASGVFQGKVSSCGCGKRGPIARGDGPSYPPTRLYSIWKGMRGRCSLTATTPHPDYAARGIKVCDEWGDYSIFKSWALASGYADSLSIDRIDSDGDYDPSNCKWSTHKEQARNRRSNRYASAFGETRSLAEWADKFSMDYDSFYTQLRASKWNLEVAFTNRTGNHV